MGEEVRRVLADIFQQGIFHTHGLDAYIITVTEVRMSPDLRLAKAFVVPLGVGCDVKTLLTLLKAEKPFLRRQLGQKMHLKFTPELVFIEDKSFDAAASIEGLIGAVRVDQDLVSDE